MTAVLITYLIFVLIVAAFGVAAVYHALKFGFPGDKTRVAVLFYVIVVAFILIGSFLVIGTTDAAEL